MNTNTAPATPPTVEPFHPQTNIFTVIMPDGTRRSVTKYRESWGVRYVSGSSWMQITHDYTVVYRGDVRAIDAAIRAQMPIQSAPAPKTEKATPKPRKVIGGGQRWFYKAAALRGLDTTRADAMKAALRCYLGFAFTSRRELTKFDYQKAAVGIERGELTW